MVQPNESYVWELVVGVLGVVSVLFWCGLFLLVLFGRGFVVLVLFGCFSVVSLLIN